MFLIYTKRCEFIVWKIVQNQEDIVVSKNNEILKILYDKGMKKFHFLNLLKKRLRLTTTLTIAKLKMMKNIRMKKEIGNALVILSLVWIL